MRNCHFTPNSASTLTPPPPSASPATPSPRPCTRPCPSRAAPPRRPGEGCASSPAAKRRAGGRAGGRGASRVSERAGERAGELSHALSYLLRVLRLRLGVGLRLLPRGEGRRRLLLGDEGHEGLLQLQRHLLREALVPQELGVDAIRREIALALRLLDAVRVVLVCARAGARRGKGASVGVSRARA